MKELLANRYLKILIVAAIFWLTVPPAIQLYGLYQEIVVEAPSIVEPDAEPQSKSEVSVTEHTLALGWRIVQILPPAIGTCEPIYHAVFSPEPFTPLAHTVYVPQCGEHRYIEQSQDAEMVPKPADPVQLTPASRDAGGFFYYNSFTASATRLTVPFRSETRPLIAMHLSVSTRLLSSS